MEQQHAPLLAVEWVKIEELFGSPSNPRRNDQTVEPVAASLRRFGWQQPVVAKPSGEVIAGNTRLKAAKLLGMELVPVVRFAGTDLDATAYAIADNRTGELAEWDEEALRELLAVLHAEDALDGVGYSDAEIEALLAGCEEQASDIDDPGPEPPPENPTSRLGDLWILGDHRTPVRRPAKPSPTIEIEPRSGVFLAEASAWVSQVEPRFPEENPATGASGVRSSTSMTKPSVERAAPVPILSALAALGAGALLALVPAALGTAPTRGAASAAGSADGPGASPGGGSGAPALWVCDRDAGQVVRLDRELLVLDSRALPRPVGVAPVEDGGAWVACAIEGRPGGRHRLVRLDRGLQEVRGFELGPVLGLAALRGDEVLALEAGPSDLGRVLRVGSGPPVQVLELAGARALGTSEGWAAVADRGGRVELLGPGGERSTVWLPGPVGPITGADGGWWMVAGEGAVLVRLTHGGGLVAQAALGFDSPRLAADGDGGLWVCDAAGTGVELRGGSGQPIVRRALPGAVALGPLALGASTGPVIATSGALLAIDRAGRLRRGQGGFARLVDVAAARAP